MTKPVTPGDLQQVFWDNVRTNQIGGKTDGINPEVAADLGFQSPDETLVLMGAMHAVRPAARRPRPQRPVAAGPIRGESEGEIKPAGHEPFVDLSQADRAIGTIGVAAARASLERRTDHPS
jgi:hypothetical protein